MEKITVKFATREYKDGAYHDTTLTGSVIDKYRDIISVEQPMPSGVGGRVDLKDFKMTADFYLILSDKGGTYRVRCKDVVIDTSVGGN